MSEVLTLPFSSVATCYRDSPDYSAAEMNNYTWCLLEMTPQIRQCLTLLRSEMKQVQRDVGIEEWDHNYSILEFLLNHAVNEFLSWDSTDDTLWMEYKQSQRDSMERVQKFYRTRESKGSK